MRRHRRRDGNEQLFRAEWRRGSRLSQHLRGHLRRRRPLPRIPRVVHAPAAGSVVTRIAVLGAGAMGSAAARLLARRSDVDLLVLDADEERARRVAAECGPNASAAVADIASPSLAGAFDGIA